MSDAGGLLVPAEFVADLIATKHQQIAHDERLPPVRQCVVAKALGCSTRYLRKLMDAGVLPFVTLPGGTERRIPAVEFARLLHQPSK